MNKRFQLRRFGHLMTWTLYGQKGQMLTKFVGLTAIFFVAMALTVWTQRDNPAWAREGAYYQITAFCVFIASMACFVFLTKVFANLKTKEQRVAYLSLPASPLEKWLGRVLYACVVLPLLVPFAFVAGDLLATLFARVMGVDYVMAGCANYVRLWSQIPNPFKDGEQMRAAAAVLYAMMAGGLALNALVLLCSTVFRHALLMSIACMLGLTFLLVGAVTDGQMPASAPLTQGQAEWLCVLLGTLALLVAAGELWLSYRVYRRMEVVPGKFTNL